MANMNETRRRSDEGLGPAIRRANERVRRGVEGSGNFFGKAAYGLSYPFQMAYAGGEAGMQALTDPNWTTAGRSQNTGGAPAVQPAGGGGLGGTAPPMTEAPKQPTAVTTRAPNQGKPPVVEADPRGLYFNSVDPTGRGGISAISGTSEPRQGDPLVPYGSVEIAAPNDARGHGGEATGFASRDDVMQRIQAGQEWLRQTGGLGNSAPNAVALLGGAPAGSAADGNLSMGATTRLADGSLWSPGLSAARQAAAASGDWGAVNRSYGAPGAQPAQAAGGLGGGVSAPRGISSYEKDRLMRHWRMDQKAIMDAGMGRTKTARALNALAGQYGAELGIPMQQAQLGLEAQKLGQAQQNASMEQQTAQQKAMMEQANKDREFAFEAWKENRPEWKTYEYEDGKGGLGTGFYNARGANPPVGGGAGVTPQMLSALKGSVPPEVWANAEKAMQGGMDPTMVALGLMQAQQALANRGK